MTEVHAGGEEAYIRLMSDLCETLSTFLASRRSKHTSQVPMHANDNDRAHSPSTRRPEDPMTMRDVRFELNLSEKQIMSLRRLWGFPLPWFDGTTPTFSRREVELWARSQPNQNNLAAVLRLRRRRIVRVVR